MHTKPCTRCGDLIEGDHSWCRRCKRNDSRRRRTPGFQHRYRDPSSAAGKPPPPPAGFRESDLRTGKPLA